MVNEHWIICAYFRDSLKQEMKLLKHEVELLPKDRRKDALR